MSKELTKKQARILAFIDETVRSHGYPPTLREIAKQFSIVSTNGVNDHLVALERKGYLRRDPMKSRGISIVRSKTERTDAMNRFMKSFAKSFEMLRLNDQKNAGDRSLGVFMVEDRIKDTVEWAEDEDPCNLTASDIAEMRAMFSRAVSGAIDALNELAADAESGPVSARELVKKMDEVREKHLRDAGVID